MLRNMHRCTQERGEARGVKGYDKTPLANFQNCNKTQNGVSPLTVCPKPTTCLLLVVVDIVAVAVAVLVDGVSVVVVVVVT